MFGTMTIEFSVLLAFNSGSTPENWTTLPIDCQTQNGQSQGKAHGGGSVAIARGGQVMQSVPVQALVRQMGIHHGDTEVPWLGGFGAAVLPATPGVQPVLVLLDAGDMIAQLADQAAGFALVF